MKTYYVAFMLLLTGISTYAQEVKTKWIDVTGTSEMKIQPNEVYFDITITATDKNGLADAEKKFIQALEKNNINKKDIHLSSANNYVRMFYNKNISFQKSFSFVVHSATNIMELSEDLNQKWVANLQVSKVNHTQLSEYRKTVKIQAIQAAKEKAQYLMESIGGKIGKPLEITELDDMDSDVYYVQNANAKMYAAYAPTGDNIRAEAIDHIEDLKIRYQIRVKFEIN